MRTKGRDWDYQTFEVWRRGLPKLNANLPGEEVCLTLISQSLEEGLYETGTWISEKGMLSGSMPVSLKGHKYWKNSKLLQVKRTHQSWLEEARVGAIERNRKSEKSVRKEQFPSYSSSLAISL